MGQESDDIVSLPAPPPPNPAARRTAIDAALRKFDGSEDARGASGKRAGIFDWAPNHRRATGGLVTAALIAVVGIPAIQVALRDRPPEIASERSEPGLATADDEEIEDNAADVAAKPDAGPPATLPVARSEPAAPPAEAEPAVVSEERDGFAASGGEQKARVAAVAPLIRPPAAAPPPPPAAPAAPMAQREAADSVAGKSENIVVTGTLVRNPNMEAAAPVAVLGGDDANAAFQERLQSAFRTGSRRAILDLIGFPLKVNFNGDVRSYGKRSEVDRDFDRIFTAQVRQSVLTGQAGRHLTFAPRCSRRPCAPGSPILITAVRP